MIFALPRQMQRWRHTSLPLLRCQSTRVLSLQTTKLQSQTYAALRRPSAIERQPGQRSSFHDAPPLLSITHAKDSRINDEPPAHNEGSLWLRKQPHHDQLPPTSKAPFMERRSLYKRSQLRWLARPRKGSGCSFERGSRRGYWLPRAWTTKPSSPDQFISEKYFRLRRTRYIIAHYENTQIVRHLSRNRSAIERRRARQAFISWKRAIHRAKMWIYRLDKPSRSKFFKMIKSLMHPTVPKMQEEWSRRMAGKKVTRRKLGVMLLCTLSICPHHIPRLIEAIFPLTWLRLPHYMIEDVLSLCVLRLRWLAKAKGPDLVTVSQLRQLARIARCYRSVMRASPPDYIRLRYDAQRIMFLNLKGTELMPLYDLLLDYRSSLGTQNMLHLASRFAKLNSMEGKNRAVDIMERLVKEQGRTFNINGALGASICCSILKTNEPFKYTKPIQLAQRLLSIGMQPNAFVYNSLISLMWRSGELQTAWSIYDQMAQLMEIKDCYTYNSLMIGSLRAGNIASLDRAFSLALQRSLLEDIDWGAFLYVIWSWPAAGHSFPSKVGINRAARVRLMLEVYSRVFEMEPLRRLLENQNNHSRDRQKDSLDAILSDGIDHIRSDFAPIIQKIPTPYRADRLKPTNYILRLMLCAYVRGLGMPLNVLEFYMHFDKMLKSGDRLIKSLVKDNSGIHNSIIKALSSFDMSRPVAYEILRDMLESNTPTASVHQNDTPVNERFGNGTPVRHPHPNWVTFNILIDALLLDGQTREAENMVQMMRDHGKPPDLVTWTVLVRGYARLQDVDGTVWSLQRMEQNGFQSNDRTMAAFNRLNDANRELALSKMQEVIEENRKTQKSQFFRRAPSSNNVKGDDDIFRDEELSDTVLDDLQREIEDAS